MDNYQQTIISQFSSAPSLLQLIDNFNQYFNTRANIDSFYANIWNIDTATKYGLTVWGNIVGVTNVVQIPVSTPYFGFLSNIEFGAKGFNQAPFWNGVGSLLQNFTLSDDDFRTLILAKALSNITNGSIPAINQILLNLFPSRGNCYVTDGQDMTMTYTFDFALSTVELAIVTQTGVLPKPVGVFAAVVTS